METKKNYIMIGWYFLENVRDILLYQCLVNTFKVSHVQMENLCLDKARAAHTHFFKRVFKVSVSKQQLFDSTFCTFHINHIAEDHSFLVTCLIKEQERIKMFESSPCSIF